MKRFALGVVLLFAIGFGQASSEEIRLEPNGFYNIPIECKTMGEVIALMKGELGEYAFEVRSRSSCRHMEEFAYLAFRVEKCSGPAASVAFLDHSGRINRSSFVSTQSIIHHITDVNVRKECMSEWRQWIRDNQPSMD